MRVGFRRADNEVSVDISSSVRSGHSTAIIGQFQTLQRRQQIWIDNRDQHPSIISRIMTIFEYK